MPFLFALRDDLSCHLRPLPLCPPVQQVVQEVEEPLAPGLHWLITVLGCRTPISLLCMPGRGLDDHVEAINQGAVGNHRGHHCRRVCHAPLDVIPPFFYPPDVGTAIMMRRGPIPAEHLAAPALMLPRHESSVAWEQAIGVPAGLKDCGVHRPTTRLYSSWPDLGIIDILKGCISPEDQASYIPRDMRKALCTAEHIPDMGPALDGSWRAPLRSAASS